MKEIKLLESLSGKRAILKESESPEQRSKIGKVMDEWKHGTLKDSRGNIVDGYDQALAIALSKAGVSKNESVEKKPTLVSLAKSYIKANKTGSWSQSDFCTHVEKEAGKKTFSWGDIKNKYAEVEKELSKSKKPLKEGFDNSESIPGLKYAMVVADWDDTEGLTKGFTKILQDLGYKVYEEPSFDGSDMIGLVVVNKPLNKTQLKKLSKEMMPDQELDEAVSSKQQFTRWQIIDAGTPVYGNDSKNLITSILENSGVDKTSYTLTEIEEIFKQAADDARYEDLDASEIEDMVKKQEQVLNNLKKIPPTWQDLMRQGIENGTDKSTIL